MKKTYGHLVNASTEAKYPVEARCGRVIKNNKGRHYPSEDIRFVTCQKCKELRNEMHYNRHTD